MNKYSKSLLAIILLAVSSACFFNVIKHYQDKAAIRAVEFAEAAFVERNVDKAFSLLAPVSQNYYSKEKIAELLITMNSPTSPAVVTATEFEPALGQELMSIFLVGENGDEKFYYRLELLGTEPKGYRVSGLFRGRGQYPPSQLRKPLPIKRLTSD